MVKVVSPYRTDFSQLFDAHQHMFCCFPTLSLSFFLVYLSLFKTVEVSAMCIWAFKWTCGVLNDRLDATLLRKDLLVDCFHTIHIPLELLANLLSFIIFVLVYFLCYLGK